MSHSFRDHVDPHESRQPEPALPPEVAADGSIPDDLVDQMFDGDVHPATRADVMGLIRADRAASDRLDATTRIFKALKQADRADRGPDLTASILARVSARSGLFSRFGLRRLHAYRYAAAATLLLAVAGVFLAQRVAPETARLVAQPAPIARVVDALPSESADVLSGVRGLFSSLRDALPTPAPSAVEVSRVVRLSDEHSELWASSGVNPPLAAILWVDSRAESPSAWPRSIRCRTLKGPSVFDPFAPRRHADVVTVSFNR
jgi:hypothetical protein